MNNDSELVKGLSPILGQLGLTEKEAGLYGVLLASGSLSIRELSRQTRFGQPTVYFLLNRLQERRLVTVKKSGKQSMFSVADPQTIENLFVDEEKNIAETRRAFAALKPRLTAIHRLALRQPSIQTYEGLQGLQEAIRDTLTAKETIRTILNIDAVEQHASAANRSYVEERKKRKKQKRLLVWPGKKTDAYLADVGTECTEIRVLPKTIEPFATSLQIYDNKVAFLTIRPAQQFAVLIYDPDIYQTHVRTFEFFWNLSVPYEGISSRTA